LIWIQDLSYIKISGLRVINSVNTGIDVENCSHITIEKNYVDSTYSPGIKAYASNNVTVEGNEVVFGCIGLDEESISISMTDIVEVKNNRVHDGVGIDVKNGSSNAIVTRNEVYNSGNGSTSRLGINMSTISTYLIISHMITPMVSRWPLRTEA